MIGGIRSSLLFTATSNREVEKSVLTNGDIIMINQLAKSEISDHIKMVSANTDAQALEDCIADEKILLGPNTTKGQGAGMDPELGKRAALESYEVIKEALKH